MKVNLCMKIVLLKLPVGIGKVTELAILHNLQLSRSASASFLFPSDFYSVKRSALLSGYLYTLKLNKGIFARKVRNKSWEFCANYGRYCLANPILFLFYHNFLSLIFNGLNLIFHHEIL